MIPSENKTSQFKWYVIHTYSGHENKVKTALHQRLKTLKLESRVEDVVIPMRSIVTVRRGKKKDVREKIFPGYMLIKMALSDPVWLAVRTTPGVTSFVGPSSSPTPISEKEVETILRFGRQKTPKYKVKLAIGEAVKIIDGPFSEFLGTVSEVDQEHGRIKVLVSIFGRETPVELDFLQVAKL